MEVNKQHSEITVKCHELHELDEDVSQLGVNALSTFCTSLDILSGFYLLWHERCWK